MRPIPKALNVSMRAVPRSFVGIPLVCVVVVWLLLLFPLSPATAQDFRITSVQVTNNDVRINWEAPGGSNYVVQVSTQLTATNFIDLSPLVPVGGIGLQSTGYTHVGGVLASTSRYYRVRSFPFTPQLQIQPTNAIIGVGMTNRYKVYALTPGSTNDVTAAASLTALNGAAQVVGLDDGFALVRGNSLGTVPLRAVYQYVTNTANLAISQLIGMYTVPPLGSIQAYVKGESTLVQVMGVFAGNQTNNITPAASLGGGAAALTRVDYNVRADVANSFALITGQSAANDSILFFAGDQQTTEIPVTWCKYTSISLQPGSVITTLGSTQQFAVVGNVADGTTVPVNGVELDAFYSGNESIAHADLATLRVSALTNGTTSIYAYVNNGAGCSELEGSAHVTVATPPGISRQPGDQFAVLGTAPAFRCTAAGTGPLSYQWTFNGTNLDGATTNSLVISNANFANAGDYRLQVMSPYGNTTSAVARLTITQAGIPIWTNRFGGQFARATVVDGAGNVLVHGNAYKTDGSFFQEWVTIKYSNTGQPLWTNRFGDSASGLVVDTSGNVFVTGGSAIAGITTVKYSSGGVPVWTNRYSGSASAIAVHTNGDVFVAGSASVAGGSPDFVTLKYSNSGTPLWTNRHNGPGNGFDGATKLVLDRGSSVYVSGYVWGAGGNYDFTTIKYSGAGTPLWTNRYNGTGNGDDNPQALAIDASSNVVVTGYATGLADDLDFVTIKYSPNGSPLWTNRYGGSANGDDFARDVAMDAIGNVFVTGDTVRGGSVGLNDYATIKYSPAGVPLWTNLYNGTGDNSDLAYALALDGAGNVFVTGFSIGTASLGEPATLKYSSTGDLLWLGRGEPGSGGYSLATDTNGNCFVTDSGFTTIKYCSGTLPMNDSFNNRIALVGHPAAVSGDNSCASKETGEPNHAANNVGGQSLWWTWTAPVNGLVNLTTCGSDFDTLLGVYTGSVVSALSPVAENDDNDYCGPGSRQSQLQFTASAGTQYQIAVDGYKYPDEAQPRAGHIALQLAYVPQLLIQPTNAVIGQFMTNRYQVLATFPDGSVSDVTASVVLTSLNSPAQVVGLRNGYQLVRGNSLGAATLRATYQGTTNTANLTVAQLTGMFTVPPLSQINGFVAGNSTSVKVMGLFGSQTNNITPASNLESSFGGSPVGTRVDYNLRADVANSFALITGQSAAAEDLKFTAGAADAGTFGVNWCWFTDVNIQPRNVRLTVGETKTFDVFGSMADGSSPEVLSVPGAYLNDFSVDPNYLAQVNSGALTVTGVFPGDGSVNVNANNGPGNYCFGGISDSTSISVVCPGYDDVDQSFNAVGGTVSGPQAVAIQPDGKILINGGLNSARLSRLDSFGNADPDFHPGSGPDGEVHAIALQLDGRILIAGNFTSYNGTNRGHIARLNADGSLDLTFDPGSGASGDINALAVHPDGNIFIGGTFSSYNGTNRSRIARLDYDGGLDTSFNPGTGVNGYGILALALRTDGKVVIAGYFSSVNGTNRNSIARLNANGSLDLAFNPGSGPNAEIDSIAEQADGKLIVGGFFSTFNGVARSGLARLNANGSLDAGFNPSLAVGNNFNQRTIRSIVVQPDGRIIVGGLFNQVSGVLTHQNLARFEANGSLDANFAACGAGNAFSSVGVVAQDDCRGHAYVGGDFILFNGVDRRYLARVFTGSTVAAFNDDFANRLPLVGAQLTTTADNSCATKQTGEPDHDGNEGGKSLWWIWTAPGDGLVTISTCGSEFDTVLAAYSGSALDALTAIASDDQGRCGGASGNQSKISFAVKNGVAYQIAVDGYRYLGDLLPDSGRVTLNLAFATNDAFAGRIPLTGTNVIVTGNNAAATKEVGEPNHAGDDGGKSLWWSWTAPASGLVTVSTCGSDFDTLLGVYVGNEVGLLSELDSSDDSDSCGSGSTRSWLQFIATIGTTYHIAVDGYKYSDEPAARSGDILLSILQ